MKRFVFLPMVIALAVTSTACTPMNNVNSAGANAQTSELPDDMRARAGRDGLELRLLSDGLVKASPGLHGGDRIAFGTSRRDVVAAITANRGAPTGTDSNRECGAGAMEFTEFGPLKLNFQQGRFVGWTLESAATPPIEEEYGLAIGSTRADLEESDQGPATFPDSTLGVEFDFGGIGGFLSGPERDARVTSLYAGTTCFFR